MIHDNHLIIDNDIVNEDENGNNDFDDDNGSIIFNNDTALRVRKNYHGISPVGVIDKGKEKMKLLDMSTQRKNMKVLIECHGHFLLELLNRIIRQSTDSNNFPMSDLGNQLSMISTFIKDFDEVKKMKNNNEIDFTAHFNVLQRRQDVAVKDK